MSHTPEQLEIAKRIATFMLREHQMLILPGDYERFADALAYATKPPEGAIEVEIAVQVAGQCGKKTVFSLGVDDIHGRVKAMKYIADWVINESATPLSCPVYVKAFLPRVAPTPVVEGSVSK